MTTNDSRESFDDLRAERDGYREAIKVALDLIGPSTDHDLGPGGVARKVYGYLHTVYFGAPAGVAAEPPEGGGA